jgi:hypothetical protein
MAPQLICSTVFGLNLMDIDFSCHLSPKKYLGCHAESFRFSRSGAAGHGKLATRACFWVEIMAIVNIYEI